MTLFTWAIGPASHLPGLRIARKYLSVQEKHHPLWFLTRSIFGTDLDCKLGPMQQVNQLTHWIDNSNVYGSSINDAIDLSAAHDGLLRWEKSQWYQCNHIIPPNLWVSAQRSIVRVKNCYQVLGPSAEESPSFVFWLVTQDPVRMWIWLLYTPFSWGSTIA